VYSYTKIRDALYELLSYILQWPKYSLHMLESLEQMEYPLNKGWMKAAPGGASC